MRSPRCGSALFPMDTLDISACPLLADAAENGAKQEDGSTVNYTKGDAILIVPSAADLITGNTPSPDDGQPADPQPSEQSDGSEPASDGLCQWCGEPHNGFFGTIVGLFHLILAFFARLFGR